MKRPLAPLALPAALLSFLAACGGGGEARSCQGDADCGAAGEARCDRGTCVANGAPAVAILAPAASLSSHVVHVFDATAVDPEEEAVEVAWSVVAPAEACPGNADPVAGSATAAEVVFWCQGTYEVVATATDPWGHAGTGRATVSVTEAAGVPSVAASGPLTVGHRCAGSPLDCEALTEEGSPSLPLSATGTGGTLAFEWTALPPPGAEAATATFAPSNAVSSPTVTVRSAGTPLAGEWRFRVRVRNELGLIAQDESVVTIANRPPAIGVAAFTPGHAFDGAAYVAEASLDPDLSDPDGDPVTASFTLLESAPSGCPFGIAPEPGGSALFTLSCADPRQLIGSVERSIRIVADDGNGGSTEATIPLAVGNRPPAIALPSARSTGHAVGPCENGTGSCYLASLAPAFSASDPDGDPLPAIEVEALVSASRPSSYGRSWRDGEDVAWVEFGTLVGLPLEFRALDGTTGFTVRGRARDPFDAEASASFPLTVTNRPPVLSFASSTSAAHAYDRIAKRYFASAVVGSIADPDGDPLQTVFTGDAVCSVHAIVGTAIRVDCARAYDTATVQVPPIAGFVGSHPVAFTANDGWGSAAGSGMFVVGNSAPTGGARSHTQHACRCLCASGAETCPYPRYYLGGLVTYPVGYSDADGDPGLADGSWVCTSGCTRSFSAISSTYTFHHTIDEGTATVATDVTVTVTCPEAGDLCILE
jgi:hypothetical protein